MVQYGWLLCEVLGLNLFLLVARATEVSWLPNELIETELVPNLRWDGIVALARTNKYHWKGVCGQLTRQWFYQGVDLDTSIEANLARVLEDKSLFGNLGPFLESELKNELGLAFTPTRRKDKIRQMIKFVDLVKMIHLFPLNRDPELKFENQQRIMEICGVKLGSHQCTILNMIVFGASIRPSSLEMSGSLISPMSDHAKFLLMNHSTVHGIQMVNNDMHIPEKICEVFFLYCWSKDFYTAKHMNIFVFNRLITAGFHESTLWKILQTWRSAELEVDGLTPEEIGMFLGNVLEAGHSKELVRYLFKRAIKKRNIIDPPSLDRIINSNTRNYPQHSSHELEHIEKFIKS